MKIDRSGLILKTRMTQECIAFYKDILNLDILFESDFLTCFSLTGNYLMIEPLDGEPQSSPDIVIRLNVENVLEAQATLDKHRIATYYSNFDWGEILTFFDPAGTKIELKDSGKFEAQVREHAQRLHP